MKRNVFLALVALAIILTPSIAVYAVESNLGTGSGERKLTPKPTKQAERLGSNSGTESGGKKLTPNPTKQAERQEKKEDLLANRKTKAYAEIDRRIEALNKLIEKVNSIKKISTEQKSLLVSQIQTEITKLTTLRIKIEADTDLATLTSDKQTIVTSYRIFVFFMPKVSFMAHANAIIELADLLAAKTTNPETLAKIASAKSTANAALTSVSALSVEGYPGNKEALTTARESLRTSLKELKDAKNSIVRTATGSADKND